VRLIERCNHVFASIHIPNQQTSFIDMLVDCANSFSPHVEITDEFTVVFNISGLGRLYKGAKEITRAINQRLSNCGLQANIAVAQNAETAILAARNFSGVTLISERAAVALADLDVENLPLTPETSEILDSWGIHTLKEFSELPESGIAERLGAGAVELQKLAQGKIDRPLLIPKAAVSYEDRVELDDEIELLDPLLFVLARSLNKLCGKLETNGMAVGEIELQLDLADGTVHNRGLRLPFPLRKSSSLLKLMRLDLMVHPPPSAVTAVRLLISAVPPRRVQGGLFLPLAPEPEKLELTLARIRSLVGDGNLGVPQLLDTHRPDAFRMLSHEALSREKDGGSAVPICPIAFRYFRPPLQAQVNEQRSRPVSVRARGIRGRVVAAAGPWRTSGDWWAASPWNRDEWDAALSDGTICRLYREPGQGWFVQGVYD
jgi:protein ImuB